MPELTPAQKRILLHSLAACTKSGGGSAEWSLCMQLMAAWDLHIDPAVAVAYQEIAIKEWVGDM